MTSRTVARTVGIHQLLAAISALLSVAMDWTAITSHGAQLLVVIIGFLALLSATAGGLLIAEALGARALTFLVQGLLLINIVIPSFVAYAVRLGFDFTVSLGTSPSVLDNRVALLLQLRTDEPHFFAGVNLAAIGAIALLRTHPMAATPPRASDLTTA